MELSRQLYRMDERALEEADIELRRLLRLIRAYRLRALNADKSGGASHLCGQED